MKMEGTGRMTNKTALLAGCYWCFAVFKVLMTSYNNTRAVCRVVILYNMISQPI
jgi:hypothetical protein